MVEFSKLNAADFVGEDDELDEEPGEVIESAPPLQVGEEREINSLGLTKKLLKRGIGWETPEFGDEVTVHYVGKLADGAEFVSTRDRDKPLIFNLGQGQVISGLNHGIITMTKGETALFRMPSELAYGVEGMDGVPPNSSVQFEVELISWITVVDVCKDGGIIKKIIEKGEMMGPPGELDEVRVKYTATIDDGAIVAKTPEDGLEFYVKEGHLCPALPKAVKTMKKREKVNLVVQPHYAFGDDKKDSNTSFRSFPQSSVLRIDLELVSFKPVVDVTGDSKVLKKILKEGEGFVTADEGASVTVRYTAMLEDGTVFDKRGLDGTDAMEFVTDEEQVIAGLDRAVMTMKKGEHGLLTIKPEYGFGNAEVKQDLAIIPPISTILYEVEILDFIKEKAPWEMNDQEKIEACKRKKVEGNLLFKNGKYRRAGKKYDKALDFVSGDIPFGDDDLKLVESLRVSCWLNTAACCLKLLDFHRAVNLCSKVLDVESSNVKALYRRAQAYMETADLHLAELDIKKALETEPQNREVKLLQKSLKQLRAESNKSDAQIYTTMFSRMTKDGSTATKRLKIDNVENNNKPLEEVIAMELEETAVSSQPPEEGVAVDSS
ncbi:70 kDa peptidyl-prolyl isomerase isoform X1 [Coffea arabica]|uniref:peptidylprolyl isomerase n=3 Tax=Coffea arabica TaxID=13443 RepID=A0A6P6UM32_COFAR